MSAHKLLMQGTDSEPKWGPRGRVLEASKTYFARIPDPAEREAVLAVLPRRVCVVIVDDVVKLHFGNLAGLVDAGPLGRLDVRAGPIDAEAFDRLLGQVARRAAALPFGFEAGVGAAFSRASLDADVLYHAFVYLRGVLAEDAPLEHALLPALRWIVREPHRRFRRTKREVPTGMARRVDTCTLVDIVAGRWPLQRTRVGGALAERLDGRLPQVVAESAVERCLDTAENRFVKSFLGVCLRVISEMRDLAISLRPRGDRLLDECDSLRMRLADVAQHGMWSEVGPMVTLPVGSTVLQRQAAYRAVFRHHNRLHLGARVPPPAEPGDGLLDLKSVPRLYEIWCCLALIESVAAVLGTPTAVGHVRRGALGLQLSRDEYQASWSCGVTVRYNLRFRDAGSGSPPVSYSVPLIPDLVLSIPPGWAQSGLHVFDAKLRVAWIDDADAEAPGARTKGASKASDIHKMHTYRDALSTRSAWVLFPGTVYQFYAARGGDPEDCDGHVEGVGCIPLRMDGPSPELTHVVRQLCSR